MEPGTLPHPRASTTLRRTVPFFRCKRLAGILVKKLNIASEPTATIGGYPRPKISTGSSNTPPPTPLIPIRIPTTKPTKILVASSGIVLVPLLRRGSVYSDEAFTLEVQNNFLSRFLGRQFPSVDCNLGIRRSFIGIRDPGEFLQNAGASLGIQALAVTLLADFYRSCDVHKDESSIGLDQLPHVFAGSVIRSDRRTNRDAAIFCDLRRHIADAPDVDITVLLREPKLRRQVLAHQVSIKQGHGTTAYLEKLG